MWEGRLLLTGFDMTQQNQYETTNRSLEGLKSVGGRHIADPEEQDDGDVMPAARLKSCGRSGLLLPYAPAAVGEASSPTASGAAVDDNPFTATAAGPARLAAKRGRGSSPTPDAGAASIQQALRSAGAPGALARKQLMSGRPLERHRATP